MCIRIPKTVCTHDQVLNHIVCLTATASNKFQMEPTSTSTSSMSTQRAMSCAPSGVAETWAKGLQVEGASKIERTELQEALCDALPSLSLQNVSISTKIIQVFQRALKEISGVCLSKFNGTAHLRNVMNVEIFKI